MLTIEERIQKTVVSLEAGTLAMWLWRAVFALTTVGLSLFYLIHEFKGLPVSQAMDEAQIGREILRGHGFETKFARPLAFGELRARGKDAKAAIWEDTYNAPIPPLLDAAAIAYPIKKGWELTRTTQVYSADRTIAMMGVLFFLASVMVLYQIAKELFDQRLAYLATGLVLICDMMWKYSISGLPQMPLLFLLHVNVYMMLRAMRANYLEEPHLGWVAGVGLGFGLMALTHALSIFIFVPVLAFSCLFFQTRWKAGALMLGLFLLVYTPWLVRNAMVCGDFRGMAGYSGLDGIVRPEAGHMRRLAIDLGNVTGNYFVQNFRMNFVAQINRLVEYLGWSCVAPVALVSVLHPFRRPVTAAFRWLLFAMWGSAICGMAVFGMKEERSLAANQFHLLFVPLFICYGMAYVLVQWDRRVGLGFIVPQWTYRKGAQSFLRLSLIIAIFLVSGIPLMSRMMDRNWLPYEWPPYAPPYVKILGDWFAPNEIIGSDMPWAVAWYADRRSLWLPFMPEDLVDISDYQKLGGPIAGLFLTPISGTQNTLGDLVNGEYRHWTGYIVRTIDLTKSPYPVKSYLGTRDCIVYMDRDRRMLPVK